MIDYISGEEAVLLCYAYEYQKIGSLFTITSLKRKYNFLKYLIPPENIEEICASLCKKQFINYRQQDANYSLSNSNSIDYKSPEFIDLVNNYIRTKRLEIIDRIPLNEFYNLNSLISDDPRIAFFSRLLALGDWEWWKNTCTMSNHYTSVLSKTESVGEFVPYLCEAFYLKELSFESKEIINHWTRDGFIYFNIAIEAITPWNGINPVVFLVKADAAKIIPKINEIKNRLRSQKTTSFILIVLGDLDASMKQAFDALTNMIILYPNDLKKIVLAKSLKEAFRDIIKQRIELRLISPYQVDGYVQPDFCYGREYEIDMIMIKKNANFAIYGNRRIGKTTLLKKLVSIYHQTNNTIYLDCKEGINSEEALSNVLCKAIQLPPCELAMLPEIIKEKKIKFIIFLDEIDDLLDKIDTNRVFGMFRALSNEGYLRFIIAGYTSLHRLSMDLQSPFYNFFNPIKLGFISETGAKQLAFQPMLSLGVNYERGESTVKQLLFYSSTHPNLVQKMCDELIKILDKDKKRIIYEEDIKRVFEGEEFYKYVSNIFYHNISTLEQLIILQNLLVEAFDEKLIYKKLHEACPNLAIDKINEALQNLILIFVFEKDGSKYKFSYKHFPSIIKKQYPIDHLIPHLIKEVNQTTG
jgi:hypothetical protein